jgi:hypothetical protein
MGILNKKLISKHIYYTPFIYGNIPKREANILPLIDYLNKIKYYVENWSGRNYKDYYRGIINLGVKPIVVHKSITPDNYKHITFNSRGIVIKLGLYETYRDEFNACIINEINALLNEIKEVQRYK